MAGDAKTSAEYIQHHLTNLTYGRLPDGSWGFAHSAEEAAAMGFYAVHVDSMAWSIGLGFVFLLIFGVTARKATSGVPGGLQNAVEMVVETIEETTSSIFSHKKPYGCTNGPYDIRMGFPDELDGSRSGRLVAGASGDPWFVTYESCAYH